GTTGLAGRHDRVGSRCLDQGGRLKPPMFRSTSPMPARTGSDGDQASLRLSCSDLCDGDAFHWLATVNNQAAENWFHPFSLQRCRQSENPSCSGSTMIGT